MKVALITGITGQDGSYLSELLLQKGYELHGIVRRASMFSRSRIEHLRDRLTLHYADLQDTTALRRIIKRCRPQEVYHLAGQSHVGLSFEIPESTCDEIARATLALLEILRDQDEPIRLYHASSSEIFGQVAACPQTEDTPFRPRSPYGCAKAFATNLCRVYRESYGMHISSGIAYNHESPRRAEQFVTRKISMAAARAALGSKDVLALGNLSASRDWGFAGEYVEAMWLMLQQESPEDCILATGRSSSVREFVTYAFGAVGIPVEFMGEGASEIGISVHNGRPVVVVSPKFFRSADPKYLCGNVDRTATFIGWKATVDVAGLATMMAKADVKLLLESH